ncbi:MAG: hypothetical protein Q8922_04195 [Bacteroidota bacterium]|nr:hypothetical protein [Bacteroidota bacterium]MDP4231781.1 hypothetical protein [Bacteroidota bacterium]MDP4243516.1 hypothetical protein [Bacteroidota bacterium]MDP4287118.1 hypothetical protein [Bacteroidota bacterium]
MKQIVLLIIIILWSVLKARRKALREEKRKQAAAMAIPTTDNAYTSTNVVPDEPYVPYDEGDLPPEVQRLLQYSRRQQPAESETIAPEQPEVVETIVPEVAPVADAYTTSAVVRPRFVFDRAAIQTFVVTREVLGPPRSKKPFSSRFRGRSY